MPRPQTRDASIRVEGLRELRDALAAVDASLVDILDRANTEASEHVRDRATVRATALGRMQAAAAESMRLGRQDRVASLRLGSEAVPFALGAEFGSRHGRKRRTSKRGEVIGWNQFDSWRGNGQAAGYFLWPTIRAERASILAKHTDELNRLITKYFPDGLPSR